jgi:hypothetical protein
MMFVVHLCFLILWHTGTVVQKTRGVITQWAEEMYRFAEHRVPFTCQGLEHASSWSHTTIRDLSPRPSRILEMIIVMSADNFSHHNWKHGP